MNTKKKTQLTSAQKEKLLSTLAARFEKNMNRHKGLLWADVRARLEKQPEKLLALQEMENSGGEPDVIHTGKKEKTCVFIDCSPESPAGRRSLCYDDKALASRKENKPKGSAVEMAEEMGITLLDEEQYRLLQEAGKFDLKTSSWVKTPERIRKLKGALFCDRRYDTVFLYHNGAESYYAARGFRGMVTV